MRYSPPTECENPEPGMSWGNCTCSYCQGSPPVWRNDFVPSAPVQPVPPRTVAQPALQTFDAADAIKDLEALAKSWVWTVPFVGPNDAYIRANADADCADQVLAIIGKIGKPK